MKTCSQCQQTLPLECFDIQSTGKLGRRADCKICRKRFIRSPEGLIKQTFSNQRAKSKKRGHPPPTYTEDQLAKWLWSQPGAQVLYNNWVNSEFLSDLRPSVDRLDDYKPYTLTNIKLTTAAENIDRYYSDAINGLNTKSAVSVNQHSLDGTFIKTFHSYSDAARTVNGLVANIRNVAEGKPISRRDPDGSIRSWIPSKAYGYIWRKP